MAGLPKQIEELLDQRSKLEKQISEAEISAQEIEEDIKFRQDTLEEQVSDARDEYLGEKHERIKEEYADKIEVLEDEIGDIKSQMESEEIDDDEELARAKETMEYLNSAAKVIERYKVELAKTSSPYFIDLAYTEKQMTIKKFRRNFSKLPKRISALKDLRTTVTQPFQFIDKVSGKKGVNHTVYLTATTLAGWVAGATPFALVTAVRRAKYLHESAELYHMMMHSLVSLQDRTDQEITSIFKALLRLKSESLQVKLNSKNSELESLNAELEEKLAEEVFDEKEFKKKTTRLLMSKQQELEVLTQNLESLEEQLVEVNEELDRLNGEREAELKQERSKYLEKREDQSVVIPTKLIYDIRLDSNVYFNLSPGLYLYEELDVVNDFLQMSIFQLRNIMEWGSIQFRVLDLLGASFASPLMLRNDGETRSQDILIYTLKEEREQVVELMHDLYTRRKDQILQEAPNLGDYNLKQKQEGSAVVPYQMIFIVLTESFTTSERLIQLIHSGHKVGLMVYVFLKSELINLQIAKTVEPYFRTVVEVSDTGLTSHTSTQYVDMLEQQEADKKLRTKTRR